MSGLINDTCPNYPSGAGASSLFLTLINTILSAKCSFDLTDQYPEDFSSKIQDGDSFDFIIVGGGTAGSVVGNILSENVTWSVLILEAGYIPSTTSEIPALAFELIDTEEDWQFVGQPNKNALLSFKNQQPKYPRGKFLGGSSSMNIQYYLRGQELDYNLWESLGNPGWNYSSILPYFLQLENMTSPDLQSTYGTDGYQKLTHDQRPDSPLGQIFLNGSKELGIPTLNEEGIGFFEGVGTVFGGERQNSGKAFLGNVKNRENLFVSYGSHVEKVLITNNRATGVLVNTQSRLVTLNANKEVILSGGTISSPQILLLSGVGPEEQLDSIQVPLVKDLPVGQNLQDHALFLGLYIKFTNFPSNGNTVDDIYNYFMYRESKNFGIGGHKVTGLLAAPNSTERNTMFFLALYDRNSAENIIELNEHLGLNDDITRFKTSVNENYTTLDVIHFLLKYKSHGQVLLKTSNPYDKPIIDYEYLQYDEEISTLLEGITFIEKLVQTEPFQNFGAELVHILIEGCQNYSAGTRDYWDCALRNLATSGFHLGGTCAMGPNETTAVVDSTLKVHGIAGLRVIDASIMPTVPAAATMGPALVIGQKGGTMVKEEWNI